MVNRQMKALIGSAVLALGLLFAAPAHAEPDQAYCAGIKHDLDQLSETRGSTVADCEQASEGGRIVCGQLMRGMGLTLIAKDVVQQTNWSPTVVSIVLAHSIQSFCPQYESHL